MIVRLPCAAMPELWQHLLQWWVRLNRPSGAALDLHPSGPAGAVFSFSCNSEVPDSKIMVVLVFVTFYRHN